DQATTPFTVIFSVLLLGTRYIMIEIVSVVIIISAAAGCVLVAAKETGGDNSQGWAVFAALTTSFAALSFVLKEITFSAYPKFAQGSGEERRSVIQLPESFSQNAAGQQLQRPLQEGSSPNTTSSDDSDTAEDAHLSIFLVGAFIGFVGLLVSVPIALLNRSAVSSGPALPALIDGLKALVERENALTAYMVYICINIAFN
ncbi:unnamed protein product, partial [Polarella glacialis]